MKKWRNIPLTGLVALSVLFSACNGGKDKKTAEPSADTSQAKKEIVAPSVPLSVMLVRHKVANFAKWKASFDSHDSIRLASGLHTLVVFRGTTDSNTVLVSLRMDDLARAKAFASSPELKAKMKEAGVTGPPMIDFIDFLKNDTTDMGKYDRIMVRHKVKDFDTWKKAFDSHQQKRMDAGLMDRIMARSKEDPQMVTLVFATADLAKAKAFMESKDLKDKMQEGGVEGPPDVFIYHMVQRY